ncbi:MAG: sigma-70 family RNA polymerase sigma factor [Clostridia bacterium]|nr:sigma-70 family RNA polymerase sigma factor [Clostridia bacterium]
MEDLVRNAKCGNVDACSKLFAFVRADLIKVARKYLSSLDDCEDAVQNAIEIALTRIYRLRHDKYFKTWLTRIVINECLKMHGTPSHKELPLDAILCNYEIFDFDSVDEDIDFENTLSGLNTEDKRIHILYHKYKFTAREIATDMGMKESTVKSRLRRNSEKIRNKAKHSSILLILLVFIATSVIAGCIISYVKGLFDINTTGRHNEGVLEAIEHLEWFQDVDMDYIDLGDGYKIKVDYLLMDEMNLYLIFDFMSENDISQFEDIAFPDIEITNENNTTIFNKKDVFANQHGIYIGDKLIESDKHHIKCLIYTYTNNFPISKTLNINLSRVILAKRLQSKVDIYSPTSFSINLLDKFVDRNYITYTSNSPKIEKAIITETGFYSLITLDYTHSLQAISLIDSNNKSYPCYYATLPSSDFDKYNYIVISNYNSTDSDTLKLIIDSNEYFLFRKY